MISPILTNSVVAQTQNVGMINHGEEHRSQLNYQQSEVAVESRRDMAHNSVVESQESRQTGTRHDAKEEGKNKYFNIRKNNKDQKPQESDGVVIMKKAPGGFDMSV